jgi:hypothetical protein
MLYIVHTETQDFCFDTFKEAELKAIQLGYNTLRDNKGGKYYI